MSTRSVFIESREWRDRNGNSYATAAVHVNGQRVHTTDRTYGDDTSAIYLATEWLRANGYVDAITWRDSVVMLRPRDFEQAGIDLYVCAYRVARKSELFKVIA